MAAARFFANISLKHPCRPKMSIYVIVEYQISYISVEIFFGLFLATEITDIQAGKFELLITIVLGI